MLSPQLAFRLYWGTKSKVDHPFIRVKGTPASRFGFQGRRVAETSVNESSLTTTTRHITAVVFPRTLKQPRGPDVGLWGGGGGPWILRVLIKT
ncbi:hypothetical protein EVAR_68176_1 [Eumeta japonica]|uniref:Uncharacterized protein n=1 Tax=Eumeta variegata TaxID=151549 RepID=A0A4C1ZZD0_EUMVA|nr:hypothetical protein EVAR_68176_1 [Eumeta japonica]